MIPLCRRSAGCATSFSHTARDALPQRVRPLNNEDRFANGDWLTIHRSHAVQIHLRVPCSWCPLSYDHDLCSRIDYVALSHFYASGIHRSLIPQALAKVFLHCPPFYVHTILTESLLSRHCRDQTSSFNRCRLSLMHLTHYPLVLPLGLCFDSNCPPARVYPTICSPQRRHRTLCSRCYAWSAIRTRLSPS